MPRFRMLTALLAFAVILSVSAQDKPAEKAPETPTAAKPDDKAAAAPAQAPSADKTEIKWKLDKDAKFFQEMTTKINQTMKFMGQEVVQNQEQTFNFAWDVKEEDKDKNAVLGQKVEAVRLKIDINGQPISYDSANPAGGASALGDFFKQIVNSEFKVTLDKAMKAVKVEGRDEFLKKLSQANQQMEPLLKQILNEEAMKQMADPTFGFVPAGPVAKGESWTRETKLNLGPIGSYKNVIKYTFEGMDGDIAKIKVEPTMTYEKPTAAGDGLPFKITDAKLASKDPSGTLLFNVKKGRLEKLDQKVKLEGELTIEISGTATKVTVNQDMTTTVTTSDASAVKKATS